MQTEKINYPCHRKGLFVRQNGMIYPCCDVWMFDTHIIGHIKDENISEKIENFNVNCECFFKKLSKGEKSDNQFLTLNIEFSYVCQADCAMCCVCAPEADKSYDDSYYSALENLIKEIKPESLLVQGGEVLVQKKTLDWLLYIKKNYPNIKQKIITNGNNVNAAEISKELFSDIIVSFVAFQPQTYKIISNTELKNTKQYCNLINKDKNIDLHLKFLITANNFHELPLFLDWAIKMKPKSIILDNAQVEYMIKFDAPFDYWNKIFYRTLMDVNKVINKNIKNFKKTALEIKAARMCNVFPFNEQWAESLGIKDNVIFF